MKKYTEQELQKIHNDIAAPKKPELSKEVFITRSGIKYRIYYTGPGYPLSQMAKKEIAMNGGFATPENRKAFNFRPNLEQDLN